VKALILAAGVGTRLLPVTDEIPKALVPVNGKPILIKQIENLYENNINDITIVSGYKSELLREKIYALYPDVCIVESTDYDTTNNMYSSYIVREKLWGHDFLMMNADVYFDSSVLTALLNIPHPNSIVVDIDNYLEESMKVVEEKGRLVEISKTITPETALGSSIDVYKFSAEAGDAYYKKCAEYIEVKKDKKKWSEAALNDILHDVEFRACPTAGRWYEIDNHEDLKSAEKLFEK